MFICEMFESKAIDPDLYGEELPLATIKQVVASIISKVDPHAHIAIASSPEGYYIVRITNASQGKSIKFDFGITADGGEITANIVNAYSNYKGAGVVTAIVSECFRAAEQLWGRPNRFVMSAHEDRGHGVWQHIAQKLGAEWEGSINEDQEDSYKEIEFVCVNPGSKGATNEQAQAKLYQFLTQVPGVIPLWQDWSHVEPGQKSLTAIYKDSKVRSTVLQAAKTLGIAVDLEQEVDGNYVDRALRGEHEGQLNEVTMVNTQSRSKRQHTDVLPNDGRPIPKGQEAEHLGELTAEMPGGYQLWSWTDRGTTTYYVFDPRTRTSQLGTSGRAYPDNRNSFVIMGTYSGPKNQYRAADLYAFLIFGRGLTLVSDNKQSTGGYRVWQELERNYGRRLNIHGFDTKTNEPVNVTTQDEPDTHVARADVKKAGPQMKKELGSISRDLRFVASAR